MADGGLFSCMQTPPPKRRPVRRRAIEEIDVDLFCGGGGVSEAFRMATGRSPDIALNHNDHAISMHQANHADTIHLRADIDAVNPAHVVGVRRVRILWASPQCTHFSKARGSAPKSVQQREQGWSVIRWAKACKPRIVLCENVEEWLTWGPLHPDDHPDEELRGQPIPERAGETWKAWVQALRDLGYVVEWRLLTACDYGAPTSRERLFVVARRDGGPMTFPVPTHGPIDSEAVREGLLAPYVSAASCIDWSIPMCSIFATPGEAKAFARKHAKARGSKMPPKRPLAAATMDRVAEGMLRFVLGSKRPFVVNKSHGGRVNDIDEPMTALTATPKGGDRHLVAPLVAKAHSNGSGSLGVISGGEPLGTNTTTEQFAVVSALLTNTTGHAPTHPEDPLSTIATGGHQMAMAAHLTSMRGRSVGSELETPAPTATGHAHEALVGIGLVNTRNGEREGQAPRVRDLADPAPTVTAQGSQGAVAAAWCVKNYGGPNGHQTPGCSAEGPAPTISARDSTALGLAFLEKLHASARAGQSVADPAPTVTTGGGKGGGHAALVSAEVVPTVEPVTVFLTRAALATARKTVAFLTAYYGDGGTSAAADGPAPTVTTKARLGLVTVTVVSADGISTEELITVTIDGELWVVVDIAMRMLTPRELALCQGFPPDYILTGTKAEQIERIGNSVSPHPAAALIRWLLRDELGEPMREAA